MINTSSIVTAVLSMVIAFASTSVAAANKCMIDGTVTFQQAPCPAEEAGPRPSIQQLNAEAKKRAATASASVPASVSAAAPAPASPPVKARPAAPAGPSAFHCDGRRFCSQMTSCAEAKYFLAHCPAVVMDGNGDGVPCEQQWCRWGHLKD
ncbi:MAG: calcium-binding protein [Burkholderiales bacterium PBB6]|nr:MAG: calcium-binding protein [Burkholderiales bacterium PBB6]